MRMYYCGMEDELLEIPGVGRSIAIDLCDLGIQSVRQLKNQNPELLYEKLCKIRGTHIDRCMLYVLRCAVYFASNKKHDPELLKWWNWKDTKADLKIVPLTPARWNDFDKLFGENGACGGCWCMWWRIPRSQFNKQKGAGNKRAIRKVVASGEIPGLIAYVNGVPAAWCSVAPRKSFPVLEGSRVLAPVDASPVWSIVCFFVAKQFRRSGITAKLIEAAGDYAKKHGAKIVEGYPIDARGGNMPVVFAWTGFVQPFRKAGFKEVARRSKSRPIMRRVFSQL